MIIKTHLQIILKLYLLFKGNSLKRKREVDREGCGGERKKEQKCSIFCFFFFGLKESISGLSMSSLVLSCTADTPKQSYLLQFQNCQIYIPLVQKAFELDKNYSCE